MVYELALMKILICQHISYILFLFQKMSAAFDGVYDFNAWDFSHEFMKAILTKTGSIDSKREICQTLCYIQNSFHSAVNAFTPFKRKHDEIVGKIKSGMEETKVHDQVVIIIVLLKRWLLQIEEGYCMGTKDKEHHGIK